jgi:hypothetical protein
MNEDNLENKDWKKDTTPIDQNVPAQETHNAIPRLASWLQQVLQQSDNELDPENEKPKDESQLELLLHSNYHVSFYQQLPDFSMALLQDESQAVVHYAPLLVHLASCHECHTAYLEIYDAMRAAIQPGAMRPVLGQGTRTLAATPHRMLAHLCRTLINQAEALYYQSRHDHTDKSVQARSLLQLALHISAHIMQSTMRHNALQDLVRVATLFDTTALSSTTDTYQYKPIIAAGSGARRGRAFKQASDANQTSQQDSTTIHLQSKTLNGTISQRDDLLELTLYDLDTQLRGKKVSIAVLLGSLIEPVRWIGGNPYAIQSINNVNEHGSIIVALGYTDLRLNKSEDRNLLEAMFLLLEVSPLT